MKMILFCGIVLVGLLIAGVFCSCTLFAMNDYGIRFRNIGSQKLYVYDALIGKRAVPCGVLIKGANADSFPYSEVPESIKIKWKKESGEIVDKEVKVKENLPSRFGNNDTIVFNINDNDEVILSFRRWGDKEIDSKGNEVSFKNYPAPDEKK